MIGLRVFMPQESVRMFTATLLGICDVICWESANIYSWPYVIYMCMDFILIYIIAHLQSKLFLAAIAIGETAA